VIGGSRVPTDRIGGISMAKAAQPIVTLKHLAAGLAAKELKETV
jgi:hypothetical protein